MRSLTFHLKVLITILVLLGVSVTAYQIFVLGIPVTEDATDDLWNIDAKVEFVAVPVPRLFKQAVVWAMPHQYTFPKPKAADRARRDAAWAHVRWMTDHQNPDGGWGELPASATGGGASKAEQEPPSA